MKARTLTQAGSALAATILFSALVWPGGAFGQNAKGVRKPSTAARTILVLPRFSGLNVKAIAPLKGIPQRVYGLGHPQLHPHLFPHPSRGRIELGAPAPGAALAAMGAAAIPLSRTAASPAASSEELRQGASWENSLRKSGVDLGGSLPIYSGLGGGLYARERDRPGPAEQLLFELRESYRPGTALSHSELQSLARKAELYGGQAEGAIKELVQRGRLRLLSANSYLNVSFKPSANPRVREGNGLIERSLRLEGDGDPTSLAQAVMLLSKAWATYETVNEYQEARDNQALAEVLQNNFHVELLDGLLESYLEAAADAETRMDRREFVEELRKDYVAQAYFALNRSGAAPSPGVKGRIVGFLNEQVLEGIELTKKFFWHIQADPELELKPLEPEPPAPPPEPPTWRPEQTSPQETSKGDGDKKDPKSALSNFGRDLVELARQGKLDPLVGREDELASIVQTLVRRTKRNPVLIGEAGVGKTQIVEGLAQRVAEGKIPTLRGKRIISLDLSQLVAGTTYRGDFEKRVVQIIKEAEAAKGNVILFVDELHRLMGLGTSAGDTNDAANMLKQALGRGTFPVIGATTADEYRNIEKDGALRRRFKEVRVPPPNRQETLDILRRSARLLEKHHGVRVTPSAVQAAVELSDKYVRERNQPDKAIDVLDEASAYTQLHKPSREVTEGEVALVVSKWTGVPVTKLTQSELESLKNLPAELKKQVIGQDPAVEAVAKAIQRNRTGYGDKNRPAGSFLLMGPTGVGKTELARALARTLFGSEKALLRLDMSEYMEKESVARMIGSPPGYIGYEEGGQLTEKVRRQPYTVILLDEVEKAHEDVLNVLLQVLEEGSLTDGHGKQVDFTNTIVIMTSNEGSDLLQAERKRIGFKNEPEDPRAPADTFIAAAEKKFRPELLNRLDAVLPFRHLTRDDLSKILDLQLAALNGGLLKPKGLSVSLSEKARVFLVEKGSDPKYGARELKRAVQQELTDLIMRDELDGKVKPGEILEADLDSSDPKKPKLVLRPKGS